MQNFAQAVDLEAQIVARGRKGTRGTRMQGILFASTPLFANG